MAAPEVVLYSSLAFLGGVLVAGLGAGSAWMAVVFAALFVAEGAILFRARRFTWAMLIPFFVFFGIFYYHLRLTIASAREHLVFNERISFSGVVRSEPRLGEKVQEFALVLEPPFAGTIHVLAPIFPEFRYGDLLAAHGIIAPAAREREMPTAAFPDIAFVSAHHGSWLKEKLLALKAALVGQFRRYFSLDSAALLSGLTFGVRSDFSKEFRTQMAQSGTTHLVALSGYNISILVWVVAYALGRWFGRRATFFLTTFVILLFVLMVGAEASVVRAALMGFLALLAKEVGRLYSMGNAIVLTAALMALGAPTVLFEIGFELSFASLMGIVYLRPLVAKLIRLKEGKESFLGWREQAATTLSAQLAVVPLLLHTFGQFSVTALLANVLILAFVPLTMALGFVLAGVAPLSLWFGFFIAKLAGVLLAYEVGVIKLFSLVRIPLPYGLGSWGAVFLFYVLLAGTLLWYHTPHEKG